jgi:mono/diheme cytochrome c family protein
VLAVVALATSTLSASAAQHAEVSTEESLSDHMHQHLSTIRAVKQFIIAGQLAGMREPAAWLAEHEVAPELPPGWEAYMDELRLHAEETLAANHLVFAAAAVSEMARTCGDCHRANNVSGVVDAPGEPAPAGDDLRSQMRRHLWSANRMWEGLIGPSDDAWNSGVTALAGIEVDAREIGAPAVVQPKVEYLLTRIGELGKIGSEADSSAARSAVYGEFLSLCADCHSWTGGGPGVR